MYQYLVIGFISLLTLIPLILTYTMVSFLVYQGQCLTAFNKCLEYLKKLLGEKRVALHFCSTQGEIEEEYSQSLHQCSPSI